MDLEHKCTERIQQIKIMEINLNNFFEKSPTLFQRLESLLSLKQIIACQDSNWFYCHDF